MEYFKNLNVYKENVNKTILNNLENEINEIRKQIENNTLNELDENGNRINNIHCYKFRVLKTIYGKLKIKRAYFKNLKTNKYFFALDKYLNLNKYNQYDNNFINEIKNLIKNKATLSTIAKNLNMQKSTLHYLIKKMKLDKVYKKKKILTNKNLFINVDDTYIRLKRNKIVEKMKIRLVAIHQGKDKKNKLINLKTFVFFPELINDDQSNFIKTIIKKNYSGHPKKIIFCSDGAKEFKFICNKNGFLQCLDKWHVLHKLNLVLVPKIKNFYGLNIKTRTSLRKKIKKLIKKTNLKKAISILQVLKWKVKNINLTRLINEYVRYLKRNCESIKIWIKEHVSTTTEGFIFHKIKSFLGNKNKSFSFDIFKKIISFDTRFLE